MCGICGYISRDGLADGQEIVQNMIECLGHRGPDQRGWHLDRCVGLGFVRLAIIDLSAAADQPMQDETGDYWITYNGEVFNYVELRDALVKHGFVFRSQSDTEVILKAYIAWGNQCFAAFRGMWAIAIWDRKKELMVFSRDPFGIKPLYFFQTPRALYWSSEIKALRHAKEPLREEPAASYLYLKHGLIDSTAKTFFKNVWPVQPAQVVTIDTRHTVRKHFYWHLPAAAAAQCVPSSEQGQIEQFRSILQQTVAISLRSDVPIWTMLSGGLDSSALVAMIAALHPTQRQHALSVVHDDSAINEYGYARMVADQSNCDLQVVKIDYDKWFQKLDTIIYHQEEPNLSSSFINHWYLMEALKQNGAKVVMSGQGVDEVLYGYVILFMGHFFADLARELQINRLAGEIRAHWRLLVDQNHTPAGVVFRQMIKGLLPKALAGEVKAAFLSDTAGMIPHRTEFNDAFDAYHDQFWVDGFDRLHNAFYRRLKLESIPLILKYEDRNSMAHSIEQRVPYLDTQIVSYLFALAPSMKVRDARSKWIMREALNGILNDGVRNRMTKVAFNTPERAWLSSPKFKGYLKDQSLSTVLQGGLVDYRKFVEQMARMPGTGRNVSDCWRVINYALWKKAFGL